MKKLSALFLASLLITAPGWSQAPRPRAPQQPPPDAQDLYAQSPQDAQEAPDADEPGDLPDLFSVPAGTHVAMTVVRAPEEGQAREGAKVYLRTRMPLHADGGVVIPARSLVVGVLANSAGGGFNQGNAGMAVRLRTVVFPNNYRMQISGHVVGTVGAQGGAAKPAASAVAGNPLAALSGLTPEQLAAVTTFALAGGELGYAVGKNQKGTMIGTMIGAGIGMAAMMASTGTHLHLRPGANVDTVLDEPLAIDPHNLQ